MTGAIKCFPGGAATTLAIDFDGNETSSLKLTWEGAPWTMAGVWSHGSGADHFSGNAPIPDDTADINIALDYTKGMLRGGSSVWGVMTRNEMDRGSGYYYTSNCSFTMDL